MSNATTLRTRYDNLLALEVAVNDYSRSYNWDFMITAVTGKTYELERPLERRDVRRLISPLKEKMEIIKATDGMEA